MYELLREKCKKCSVDNCPPKVYLVGFGLVACPTLDGGTGEECVGVGRA